MNKLVRIPALDFKGVVLELEYPSRHDMRELCSGSAHYVLKEALEPLKLTRYHCEIRVRTCAEPYPDGTRVVLLCGEKALPKLGRRPEQLNALRGSPFLVDGIVYIPTYHPQQCADRANYERAFNPAAHDTSESADDDADAGDDADVKDMGRTARRNYRFWFIQDMRKAVRIARGGYAPNNARYETNLTADGIIGALRRTTSETPFILDIETNPSTGQMICFAWSNDEKVIYVAPILNYNCSGLSFNEPVLHIILRELCCAISRASTVVAHNALFDLLVLAWRYKIIPPAQQRIYDTMVSHARIHVDTEKSLGHCTSLYTDQPYHKDEGIFNPSNHTQWQQLLTYNAKDVETTTLVWKAQVAYAQGDRGLQASIAQGNALVRPLLLKSLRGLLVNTDALCARIDALSAREAWIEKNILAPLAGETSFNPRSPKQVCALLYEKFGLPKSSDPTVSASDKDAMYRLLLKCPIPTIKTILHLRSLSKERGTLGAKLWRTSHLTCAYVITGTKTFRLSSRKLLGVWGTNLQNWSKKMRGLVRPHPGCVLVQVDQSGAEALIVAYIAPPGRYRDLFIHKVSPHVYFGLFAFPEVWKAELGFDITYLHGLPIAAVKGDSRWSEISRCIKASDNNPPNRRYYYFQKQINHCVKAGYKVLTPAGWELIESNPKIILCFDPVTDQSSFQDVVRWNNFDYSGTLFTFCGKECTQEVTPNHTIAYWSNGKMHTDTASKFSRKFRGSSFKAATKTVGGYDVKNELLSLVLALQADGHIHKECNRWTFRFGKERKIIRLKAILDSLAIAYNEILDTDLYIKLVVIPDNRVYDYLDKSTKQFKFSAFINLSANCREHICREVFQWDGQDLAGLCGYQTVYRTACKHNAEVIYTILRISGWGSTINRLEEYYTVSRNIREYTKITTVHACDYIGTVHCPQTSTGFFIVQSPDGKISVTGNSSNYGIKAQRFAANLLEKSEGQVHLPVHECDRLLKLYHGLYPEITRGFQGYVKDQLFAYKTLRNLFGYPRRFYGWVEGDDTILKDAFSWIPQSTVGCITGLADSALQERIDSGELTNLAVWQNNHDSLLVECPADQYKEVARVVCDAMNIKMKNHRGEEFAMRSEASVGEDWYHMEEIKI